MKKPNMMADNIDMGMLNEGKDNKAGEAVGNAIDSVTNSFFNISSDDLKLLAHIDDFTKVVKNMYLNSGNFPLTQAYSLIDTTAQYGIFTDIKNLQSVGMYISHITYELTPPSPVLMDYYDENGSLINTKEFNTTSPILASRDEGYLLNVPSGLWSIKFQDRATQYYDLSIVNQIGINGHFKSYVPSLKFELNSDGDFYKIAFKWYLYDGSTYQEVNDLTSFWLSVSRLTLRVDGLYDMNIALGATEVLLTSPINPTTLPHGGVTLAYGFYGSEILLNYDIK